MQYIYLHGFASSPQSAKAQYLRDRFAEVNLPLHLLDFNQNDFSHLTLSRQLQQTAAEFPADPNSVTLIGSSFGGLTAAWLAERYPQIARIVCLAPAFGFLSHWLPKLGETTLHEWQKSGYLPVYHYTEKRKIDLHYGFILDAKNYDESQLQRPVPTLIIHGVRDETIPIQASRDYAAQRPWVELMELDSDHSLGEVLPQIWQEIQQFCD
ncbi:YqiA/YcfP family alpha/beta fold hydrolase [Oscillatoria sp. FACHB-1406]|uniref:YqiA/YcfP family alpha/beta fold hydrolase n=1 Tax=Oscillatoria sp. FACHB-1406 TaxID=2692846 RepID=UPI0016845555|nr:YqiA/YcfP family alpha/beta fold hydrolase [Oscillatoria sp. FACHB-1406]MBD2579967.1 alpha/beta fold hydrolase [Oscillatoria sp. FACHB-1406]